MTNKTPGVNPVPEAITPDPASEVSKVSAEATDGQSVVRYMDDATFQRSLEKVVTVHDRLLAELAK